MQGTDGEKGEVGPPGLQGEQGEQGIQVSDHCLSCSTEYHGRAKLAHLDKME